MPKLQLIQGAMRVTEDEPNWEPLLALVGSELARDFMWMFAADLDRIGRVEAYKHADTRAYLHLDQRSNAFWWVGAGRYRPIDGASAVEAVFDGFAELAGVTPDDVAAAEDLVARLRRKPRQRA